jgi:ABC-type nitrate/sulfonate/bicarbonate transport system permease component
MPRRVEAWFVRAVQALTIGLVLLLWELAAPMGWSRPEMLPPFSNVLSVLFHQIQQARFRENVLVTALEISVAFIMTVPIGLLSGFIIGESPILYRTTRPVLQAFMAVPKAMFLPFFVIVFGIGFLEKAAFAGLLGLFVVIINAIVAVHSIPQGLILAAKSMGASRSQLYLRIYLPGMLPLVLGGIRVGLIFTIFGVLLAEMYASTNGLGRFIFEAGEAFRFPDMLAGVLLVVVATIAANEALRSFEVSLRRKRGIYG